MSNVMIVSEICNPFKDKAVYIWKENLVVSKIINKCKKYFINFFPLWPGTKGCMEDLQSFFVVETNRSLNWTHPGDVKPTPPCDWVLHLLFPDCTYLPFHFTHNGWTNKTSGTVQNTQLICVFIQSTTTKQSLFCESFLSPPFFKACYLPAAH